MFLLLKSFWSLQLFQESDSKMFSKHLSTLLTRTNQRENPRLAERKCLETSRINTFNRIFNFDPYRLRQLPLIGKIAKTTVYEISVKIARYNNSSISFCDHDLNLVIYLLDKILKNNLLSIRTNCAQNLSVVWIIFNKLYLIGLIETFSLKMDV